MSELEQFDECLGLEVLVQTRQRELNRIEETVSKAQEKSAVLNNQNQQLQQELSSLKAQIADERNTVVKELKAVDTMARNTVTELKHNLSIGMRECQEEVAGLTKDIFEAGKEFGQMEAMVRSNAWFEDILSLIKGEDNVTASQVRVVALILLKSIMAWLERRYASDMSLYSLRTMIANLITELERWKPQVNSAEGSKSLSVN